MIGFFDEAVLSLATFRTPVQPIHSVEGRTYGFALPQCEGLQFALKPLETQMTIFAQRGEWEQSIPSTWKVTHYTKEKTRSSHLPNCAPNVALGQEAVAIGLKSFADFTRFMEIYTQ